MNVNDGCPNINNKVDIVDVTPGCKADFKPPIPTLELDNIFDY